MKNSIFKIVLSMVIVITPLITFAQFSFTNANSHLSSTNFHSGCPVTIVDWNNDGLDDVIKLDQGHICSVEIQSLSGNFSNLYIGDFGPDSLWGMVVADVDQNGYVDVFAGGYASGTVRLFKTDASGVLGSMINLPNSNIFLQNATCGDFNNDGWIDIFCCHDNGPAKIWLNDGAGNFPSVSGLINFNLPNGSDNSGNYGSTWTDFDSDGDLDFYIAKCRQFVSDPTDFRRRDVLFMNNGSYNFSAYTPANTQYWTDSLMTDGGAQTWTCNFGDIDNDGDLDIVRVNYDQASQIMINDGSNHYVDITATSGFDVSNIFGIESVFEDFDNDGYLDILVTGYHDIFFHNNGNNTFSKIDDSVLPGNVGSFAIGDLNHDGAVDLYASYNEVYTTPTSTDDVVFLNNLNANNWITFNLIGTVSNHDAIGARVTLYGAWGKQIREVHAGESYGTCNSRECHFGIGTNSSIDSAVIHFPSGIHMTILNPGINQFVTVPETATTCSIFSGVISTPDGPVICSGNPLTLTATLSDSYLWSDGETTQSIIVSTTGDYSVQLTIGSCVSYPATIHVLQNPDQTPTISINGLNEFCEGSASILSTTAISYTWSNGETTQSITPTQSGTYMVTTQGNCQTWQSNSISITVFPAPVLPVGTDDFISQGNTATISATGNEVHWFDLLSGGIELATGNNFTTPVLNTTTTYYAENRNTSFGQLNSIGQTHHYGATNYSGGNTYNANNYFDVSHSCILKSIKVFTDTQGARRFEVKDAAGNIIDSLTVFIPIDTTVVLLNFDLPVGNGYTLTTDASTNSVNLGFVSPRFQRSDANVSFPYTINGIISLTGNDLDNAKFYYFYDWQVEATYICYSNRTPVTAHVSTGISSINSNIGVTIFPNPSEGMFAIESNFNFNKVEVIDLLGRKVLSSNNHLNELNLSNFSKGTYILQLTDVNNTTVRRQLIVQ